MNSLSADSVPHGWAIARLSEIADINPPLPDPLPGDSDFVSFVPMAAVEAMSGRLSPQDRREWRAVKKGFTRFWEGDVLFAKITPCMENGKVALAANLHRGVGTGSTEFHVLRSTAAAEAKFLMYYALQEQFRKDARASMTGTAGQLRVPASFLRERLVAVPPLPEQRRIIAVIESCLSRLDAAAAALERARANLKRYRASVLKAAVEGRLVPTEAELARKEGRDFEPASVLLDRILAERRRRWEGLELARMKAAGRPPKGDRWKSNYKEPLGPATAGLPEIPEGWAYTIMPALILPFGEGMKTGPFGTLLQKREHRLDGVPVIGIESIKPLQFVWGSKIHVTAEKASDLARYDLRSGDLIISRSGTVGDVCVVPDNIGDVRFSTNVMRIRFLCGAPIPEFIAALLNGSPFVLSQISDLCRGTTRDFLNQQILSAIAFPLPPLNEQHRILQEIDKHLSVAKAIEDYLANQIRSERLRQSILKTAFDGRLVDQNPNDEPASRLIERIRVERATRLPDRSSMLVPEQTAGTEMSNGSGSNQIVLKLWNFCNVLRDDGLSYQDYLEQLVTLLFLKMADERAELIGAGNPIPAGYRWSDLAAPTMEGARLEEHYRQTLIELGKRGGMLGIIFRKAQNKIQDPAKLRQLIVELIGKETWTSMSSDVKGDAYEGLLEKNAEDTKSGAGQYFTPRVLIDAIVDCIAPHPGEVICDPACGTGGFLLSAYHYIATHYQLDLDQKRHLRYDGLRGIELVDGVTRLCAMNMLLHGIGPEDDEHAPPIKTDDALRNEPTDHFEVVITNPPFGKKSSITVVNEEGETDKQSVTYTRPDFWTTTSNKQLNFLQHVKSLLAINGRSAIVVPDNVLFEGGAGETVRRKLISECDLHTVLRLPTGIFYAQGVKANVLFFDRRPASETPWTKTVWFYDFRTNMHFTLKQNRLSRADLDDFVACFNPANRHDRKPTWHEGNPEGRWRPFTYEEVIARDKANLDLFWLRDESLEDSASLPDPHILAAEIAEDLRAALEQIEDVLGDLTTRVASKSQEA